MNDPTQRLDKWLWFARFARTRGLATKLIEAGAVTLRGQPASKASAIVRIGDPIGITVGRVAITLRVAALGTRRGPAAEARHLYEEFDRRDVPAEPWDALLSDADDER